MYHPQLLAYKYRIGVLIVIVMFAVVAILFFERIPQDPSYHQFADTREIAGIPNFWNVVSNLPFLLLGFYGLQRCHYLAEPKSKQTYITLCIGIMLVSIGSTYYHYAPSTASLLWDRLPMTVAFMALFSLLLDERVILSKSLSLWPLLVIGISSAVYWYWTEAQGVGDLRPYVLVQFLPMILIPIILLLFRGNYLNSALLIAALAFYLLAKIAEHFDKPLFASISGHTVKHLLSSIAVLCIILAVPIKKIDITPRIFEQ